MRPHTSTVLALALLALMVALAAVAAAQTDPPAGGGDWTVEDATFYNSDYTLRGNLTVNSSGQLRLDNMTLTVQMGNDGEVGIYVEEGALLEMTNVRVLSADGDAHYWFVTHGRLDMIDCDVRDVASNEIRYNIWDEIAGGVQIYNSSSRLIGSRFHDCQRINVFVEEATPTIHDCEFENAEYVSTYDRYTYSWTWGGYINIYYADATGLYLDHADPNITECTFTLNGLPNTALPFYSTSYGVNGVTTYGRGILAYDSSPNITDCEFRRNGEQPVQERVVSGVRQIFFESFYYSDDPYEGGLVCVGSSARPRVEDSSFYSNDVFGICGWERGFPPLVDRCVFNDNKYVRRNPDGSGTVYSPSAGIYVYEGSGKMVVANTTFVSNVVVANIYTQSGPSVHILNFSNSDNTVDNAYNIYLGDGKHVIRESFLDGRPNLLANLFVGYSRNEMKIRILESTLLGGQYGVYSDNYRGTYIFIANSSISGPQATFYLESTTVDAVNCTMVPYRVDTDMWNRGSTVRIMYYLSILITWQNEIPIEGAFVQVFNATSDFVYGGITDENGTIGPIIVTSKTYLYSGGSEVETSNSPLYCQAYSSGLKSIKERNVFEKNLLVDLLIYDHEVPTIHIFTPGSGHAQNTTLLEIRGMTTDVGAGVNATFVGVDGGTWTLVAIDVLTWSTVLELTEGTHDVHILSTDKAGNERELVIQGIIIDLTPPTLEVIDPVKATWFTNEDNYTLRGRVWDDVRLQTLVINRKLVPVDEEGVWSSPQPIHSGTNEFSIMAIDHVGNVKEVIKAIVRDSTVPKLILTSPEDGTWTNVSQVEVKGITELGAMVRVNGEPVPTFGGRFAETILLTEGTNHVTVEAIDKANNVMRLERTVTLDSIPPVLRIENPLGDTLTNEPLLDIRGRLDDPSVQNVVVNGLLVPVQALSFVKVFRLDEGLNPITVEVWDRAQNHRQRTFMVTLDTTAPELVLLEPEQDSVTTLGTVLIRGRTDADATFFMWTEPVHPDFDPYNIVKVDETFRYDDLPLVEGLNVIHLESEDEVGNVAHMRVTVDYDLRPPEMVIYPLVEETFADIVDVRGILLDGDEVRINGRPVVLDLNGEFTEPVRLKRGKNQIRVTALDQADNRVERVVNVTRTSVEPPEKGILGTSVGISALLVIIMLLIGMAVLYPGAKVQAIEPEALVGEPIIVEDEAPVEVDAGQEPTAETPPERPGPPRRPPPPAPPDHTDEPGSPPVPPWRRDGR